MDQGPDELRERLADLHRQLQTTRSASGEIRELLAEVLADIDRLLAGEGEPAAEPAAAGGPEPAGEPEARLSNRLADAAQRFEETHPQLAANIGSVVTALSRLGI